MGKQPIIILESSLKYQKGSILTEYKEIKEGVVVDKTNDFLPKTHYIKLNESLSPADEKRIKELIASKLKYMFWQMFTKSNFLTSG
jgi:hypothetical protein